MVVRGARADLAIIPPGPALQRAYEAGLKDAYLALRRESAEAGLVDPAEVRQLGKAIGGRYLLLTHLVRFRSQTITDLRIIVSFGRRFWEQSVELLGELWDTERGEVVWAGHGLGVSFQGVYDQPATFVDLAHQASVNLVKALP